MANPNNDLSHFYNNNQTFFTTATTTTTTATSANSPLIRRVSKPTRRRSRASRRTPTTLLNTDTSNFRAMVQQYTGGPSAVAFASSSDPTARASSVGYQYGGSQNLAAHNYEPPQQHRLYNMLSPSSHVSIFSYPNTAVSDGFVAVDESRDGGGGGYAPSSSSSERNNINTSSWLQ
ncbi:unnamed protein product [Cochlearia groenlandica]